MLATTDDATYMDRKKEGSRKGIPNGFSIMGETKSVRVPIEILDDVKTFIKDWKQKRIKKLEKALQED